MRRLAAIAVIDTWEGDWQPAQGNEIAAVAAPIGHGEMVRLEVDMTDEVEVRHIPLSAEPTLLNSETWIRYRVVKDGSRAIEKLPTTVELILYVSRRKAG